MTDQAPRANPEAAARKRPRGAIFLHADRCKGCGFCIAFCPPKVLAFAADFNRQGYHPPHLVNPEGCTGCDLCGLYCPDFAIYGVMLKNGVPVSTAGKGEASLAPTRSPVREVTTDSPEGAAR